MAYDSWYCSLPSFVSDRISNCIPTAADQVSIMQGNFGAKADPVATAQATADFQDWLVASGYDANVASLQSSATNNSWMMIALLGVGVVGAVSLLAPRPRRYGR